MLEKGGERFEIAVEVDNGWLVRSMEVELRSEPSYLYAQNNLFW